MIVVFSFVAALVVAPGPIREGVSLRIRVVISYAHPVPSRR